MIDQVTVNGRLTASVVRLSWSIDGERYSAWIDQTSYEPYIRTVVRGCDGASLAHCSHGFAEAVSVAKRTGLISAYRLREEATGSLWDRLAALTADRLDASRIVGVLRDRS